MDTSTTINILYFKSYQFNVLIRIPYFMSQKTALPTNFTTPGCGITMCICIANSFLSTLKKGHVIFNVECVFTCGVLSIQWLRFGLKISNSSFDITSRNHTNLFVWMCKWVSLVEKLSWFLVNFLWMECWCDCLWLILELKIWREFVNEIFDKAMVEGNVWREIVDEIVYQR